MQMLVAALLVGTAAAACPNGYWGNEPAQSSCNLQSGIQCRGGQDGDNGAGNSVRPNCVATGGSYCSQSDCETWCAEEILSRGSGCCFWHSGLKDNKCEFKPGVGTKSAGSNAKYGATCADSGAARTCFNTCTCNGRATSCDMNTGVCQNCQDGTTGDHCEDCDAASNYFGTDASDCNYCVASTTCSGHGTCNTSHGTCDCNAGYMGASCVARTCQGATSFPGGSVSKSNGGSYPSTATYSCDAGFELSGSQTRACSASGGYAGSTPSCAGVPCQGATSFPGGSVSTSNGGLYPSMATYSCGTGYLLEGNETRVCGVSGSFAGYRPACIAPSTTEAATTEEVDDTDTDGDGVSDLNEGSAEQPPPDADNDTIPDYLESNIVDSDSDGLMNQHDPDDDNDSQPTRMETASYGSACASPGCVPVLGADGYPDTDGDGTPDYLDEDDDGDGMATVDEILQNS